MAGNFIVVGVDASEPSKAALRWAQDQAALTGAGLRVVMSWAMPTAAYWAPLPAGVDLEASAREVLHQTVEEVLGGNPPVPVTEKVVEGHPAQVLIEQSKGAELLVVGSRGHGEFTGMLLGSVSEHVVTQAACTVVVVRR